MKALLSFLIFFFLTTFIQRNEKKLIGKWECYKLERSDGVTKGVDMFDNEFEINCDGLILHFKPDSKGWESWGLETFTYQLKDSILKLGTSYYVVELLNDKELRIRDYDPEGISLVTTKQSFKKIK